MYTLKKKTMPFFSVVMPAYNAGKYIREAIQSIIDQTFPDWELTVVDDCSIDDTSLIVRSFSDKDDRVKLYERVQNSRSAYIPRKEAILKSTAPWIVSLDADDWLDSFYLEKIYKRIVDTDVDIVLQRMYLISDRKKLLITIPEESFDMRQIMSGEEACMKTIVNWEIGAGGAAVAADIYRRVWEQENNPYIGMNADELLTRKLFLCANKIAFSDGKYYYRQGNGSITHKFSVKWFDILDTDLMIEKLIEKHFGENSEEALRANLQVCNSMFGCAASYSKYYNQLQSQERKEIRQRIKVSWKQVRWKEIKRQLPFLKYEIGHLNFAVLMFFVFIRNYAKR